MKIAFVKMKYVPYGGAETYLAALADGCARLGHEVHLITAAWPAERAGSMAPVIVPCRSRSRAGRARSFSRAASEAAARGNYDAVLSLNRTERQDIWRASESVHAVWLRRRREFEPRWKTWFNARSAGHRALLELERRCAADTPFIIANSRLVRGYILTTHPIPPERVTVIYNGIDLERYSPGDRERDRRAVRGRLRIPAAEKVLLFVGNGFRHKGLPEALRLLRRLDRGLLLVCGRDRENPWRALARRLGVDGRVRFLGAVPAGPELYRAADLTLLPSWSDSFGFSGLESLACGTPLLTTSYAGCAEILREGLSGTAVCTPAAIEAMAEAARKELATGVAPDRARAIADSVAAFSIERNVAETMKVIEKAAERKRAGSRHASGGAPLPEGGSPTDT
ncbi:MAG: glycosyltransferase family 4 protein [Lentisphaerae bacterium]|nr:glycosyltransferase family 4 protein [Lentisphaerota bacterium]